MKAENTRSPDIMKTILNGQRTHWMSTFSKTPDMFGTNPSDAVRKGAELFQNESKTQILELGGGQGRDTIFLVQNGFKVYVLDYSESGVEAITRKAQALGLSESITAKCRDVRDVLPFDDESFDGCYSHMLYCMALTTEELEFLSAEVRRVLKPGGLHIYTVRHTDDPDYGTGIHRGEDMYEINGFIVHFFSRERVEHLAKDYEIVSVDEFEEGDLPKRLFQVILRKKDGLASGLKRPN